MSGRGCVVGAVVLAVVGIGAVTGGPAVAGPNSTTKVRYDASSVGEYQARWDTIYGPLELAAGGSLTVGKHAVTMSAEPFHVGADFSVFDHLKYLAVSTEAFPVPESGSLEFSVDILASTPGTQEGRVVRGCYGPPGTYAAVGDPCDKPFSQVVRQGQQAAVSLNMINFPTGQLFDWLVSEDRAIALVERLPSTVTGTPGTPVEDAYTQIITEVPIKPGKAHTYSIRYTRTAGTSRADYTLDGTTVVSVDHVGIPLDVQGVPFSGYAASLGGGEPLRDDLDSFVIGHGLFSLLDAFPYQHPDAPELSVSIPMTERLFGQGATGTWDDFVVTTRNLS